MGLCDFSLEHGDYDPPSCCCTKWRKARKDHKCCECGDVIAKGSRYEYTSGVWDGYPDSFRTCELCAGAREQYMPHGHTFQCLWDEIYEALRCMGARHEDEFGEVEWYMVPIPPKPKYPSLDNDWDVREAR